MQSVHLLQELSCPNSQGLYFLQRASLEKCIGRVFLLSYSFLSSLPLIEKLEIARLPEVTRVAINRCSLLRFTTDVSYLLYRLSVLKEGIQSKRLLQVVISLSKIFTTASFLILRMLKGSSPFFILVLTGVSVLTDVGNLSKTRNS